MAFTPTGVEFQAKGLAQYLSGLKKADQAQQALGRSASGIGGKFGLAQTQAGNLGRTVGGLGSSLNSSLSSLSNFGSTLSNVALIAGGAAVAGVTALGAALAVFAVGGIKQAIDLDQQVANIAATMGATKETAGILKEELKDLTLDLALDPNLTVDVTQAGQAIQVLAANGALATDEFGKLTQGSKDLAAQTVALANATGSDFATAAAIATDAGNIFGLEVDEMGRAIDGATGVMNASKFDANDYALALANVGPVAAGMGIPLEDLNTVIAGTASNFASGSDAGTSFKTLLQRLANPTKEVQTEMDRYGISIFDADGKMRDMKDVVADLNRVFFGTVTVTKQVGGATKEQANAAATAAKNMDGLKAKITTNEKQLQLYNDQLALEIQYYGEGSPKVRQRQIQIEKLTNTINGQKQQLGGYEAAIAAVDGAQVKTVTSTQELTEAQRAQLAATLGGADGSRILLGLAGMTAEEFDTLSESVNRSGQGLEAAALRVDTVKGAMDIFRGVIQAIQIQIGDAFLPLLKQMAINLTGLATKVGPQVVAFFGQIATGISQAITSISTGIEKVSGAFGRFGVRGATVSILGLLGFSPEEIATITPTVDAIIASVNRVFAAFETFGARGAAFSILGLLGLSSDTMVTINTVVTGIITTISNFASQIMTILGEISFAEIMGALTGIGVVLAAGVFAALVAGLMSILTPINLIIAGAALLGAAWAGNWGNIQGITEQALTTITNLFNTYWPIIQAVTLTAWEVLKGIFAGFQTALGPVITQLQAQFTQIGTALADLGITWPKVWDAIVIATGIVAAAIGAIILGIIGVVAGLATGLASGISATIAMFQSLSDNVAGIINGLITIFSGWVITISALLSGDFARAWEGFKIVLQGAATFWTSMWTGMLDGVLGIIGIIASTIGGFVQGVVGFFQGMYDQLVGHSIIPDMINDIVAWFKKLPQLILSTLTGLADRIKEPFEDTWEGVKEAINLDEWTQLGIDAIDGLLEGMKEKAGDVLEFIKNLARDSLQGLGQFWGAQSPATEFIPLGMSVPQGIAVGINQGANLATQAVQNMGQNLISSASNVASFIDSLNMGNLARGFGGGGSGWKEMRRVITAGFEANFGTLVAGGDPAAILGHIQQVAQRFNFPPSMAAEFAKMNGLVEMVTDKFKAFQQQVAIENLGNLTQATGSLLSLGSTFADVQQQQMGSTEEANKTVEAYKKLGEAVDTDQNKLAKLKEELAVLTTSEGSHQIAIDKKTLAVEKMTESIEFNKSQLAIYEQEIAGMELGTLAWEKKKLQIDKTTESIDAQEQQLVTLQQELEKLSAANNTDTLAIEKKRLEIEKLTQEMAKNQEAVIAARKDFEALATGSAADQIAFLQAFLDSGQESIRLIGEELGGVFAGTGATADVYWTRVDAQEKLNELLEEQRRQEEQIVRQKELQQKFDLLKAQVDLRKQAMDLGIALPAGMKFGLNAGIDGMLKTVNDLTEALINQINSDLQIGSPSKLMIKTFKQVMAGAAIGMERGQSLLSDAVRSIPILNGQIPQPAFSQAGGGGNTYNTYYEMPMTVNTAATSQGVIRQYDIRRSMVAAG